MWLKKFIPVRPENAEQVAENLELHDGHIPETRRLVFNLPGSFPRPSTVHIMRPLRGAGLTIPRQFANYARDFSYWEALGSNLGMGLLYLDAKDSSTGSRRECSLIVPDFTHAAIGSAVMSLLGGEVAYNQGEQALLSGEVYDLHDGDPLGLNRMSPTERQAFREQLRAFQSVSL